jgi:hypothetical protein
MARTGLLPTPTSTDYKRANEGDWSERKNPRQGRRLVREASKLLPTPTARDWKGADLPNRDGGPSLGHLASQMTLGQEGALLAPAPENVAKAAPPAMVPLHLRLPTPTTDPQAPNKSSNQKNGSPCLEEAALALPAGMIPTPSATDAKGSRRHGYMIEGNAGTTLTDYALGTSDSPGSRGEKLLCLNPRFVEWLMGWPIDHTLV